LDIQEITKSWLHAPTVRLDLAWLSKNCNRLDSWFI